MGVSVIVDETLLAHARKVSGEADLSKLVELALNEMIRRRSKLESLLALAGQIEFYEGYDYKKLRASRYDNS